MPKANPKKPKSESTPADWKIFQGDGRAPHDEVTTRLPEAPSWRPFGKAIDSGMSRRKQRAETFQTRPEEVAMINAALYLRRPLLVTGNPGTGKSSLAYAVARELNLGEVLYWPITTRTTLKDGLYHYDAIGRLQEVKQQEVKQQELRPKDSEGVTSLDEAQMLANYITLGPLGTAFLPSDRPRILIVDEIDKSDIDLPNDLLTIFEEGRFEIPELVRLERDEEPAPEDRLTVRVRTAYLDREDEITGQDWKVPIQGGQITCREFPLVILTSNGERDFPPPFLRRCLRLNMQDPERDDLERIVKAHLKDCDVSEQTIRELIDQFLKRRDSKTNREQLATDQLLNALFFVVRDREGIAKDKETLINHLLAALDRPLETKLLGKSGRSSLRGEE